MSVYQEAYHLPEFTYDKYEMLKIEQRGPVYICSFNDPGNLNAMSYKQMTEYNDFLNLVRYDKDCRVIVLTGEGKSFCAGFNLNDLFLEPPEDMGRIQRDFYVMQRICSDQVLNMAKCEQPIIGALKGFAVGGGLSIGNRLRYAYLGRVLQDERWLPLHWLYRYRHVWLFLLAKDRWLRTCLRNPHEPTPLQGRTAC